MIIPSTFSSSVILAYCWAHGVMMSSLFQFGDIYCPVHIFGFLNGTLALLGADISRLKEMALPVLLTWIPCLIRNGSHKDIHTGFFLNPKYSSNILNSVR